MPGAEWASITTDPAAHEVDMIQYELRTGPCVDAILQETVFGPGIWAPTAGGPSSGGGLRAGRATLVPL